MCALEIEWESFRRGKNVERMWTSNFLPFGILIDVQINNNFFTSLKNAFCHLQNI